MLSHLEEKVIDNYYSDKKRERKIYHIIRKKNIILITLYKLNLPSDE